MKNVTSRAAIRNFTLKALVAVATFGAASSAQAATANINASATIIPPIVLSQPADIRFGNIAAGAIAGTIVMAVPATIPAVGPTTALPVVTSTRVGTNATAVGGTCTLALACGVGSFQIDGLANGSFATVTTPATVNLAGPGPAMTLTIAAATNRRYGAAGTAGVLTGAGTLSATGTAFLLIGGTLAVGTSALQTAGAYTVVVPVTVDY
jgi:Domain of unknown function (DUF4402)